jgi:uncharacterized RDD family membrane protein YckC
MIFCTGCGIQNAEGTKFCVKCGAPMAPPAPGSWRGSNDLKPVAEEASLPQANFAPPVSAPVNPTYAAPSVPVGTYQPNNYQYSPVFQMNYAQWLDRVVAAIIDGAIVTAIMIVLMIVVTVLSIIGAAIHEALAVLVLILSWLLFIVLTLGAALYNKVYLASKRGYSIGQGVMKLKVVTEQGQLVPLGTMALRFLVQIGIGFIPFAGIINVLWPLWDVKRQTLHDKAVNTYVIKTS